MKIKEIELFIKNAFDFIFYKFEINNLKVIFMEEDKCILYSLRLSR